MLASIVNAAQTGGYPGLFLLVMAESSGIPVPGETALIRRRSWPARAGCRSSWSYQSPRLRQSSGDTAGYLISRRFGRTLLERPGLLERRRRRVLEIGEPFLERHGPKAVFFGRWILGLRTWASWPAGANKMPWRSFAVWNAVGAISCATTIGLVAYLVDNTARSAITAFGLYGLPVVVFAGAGSLLLRRLNRSSAPWPRADHQRRFLARAARDSAV